MNYPAGRQLFVLWLALTVSGLTMDAPRRAPQRPSSDNLATPHAAAATLKPVQTGGPYNQKSFVVAGGGDRATGGSHVLTTSLGQPLAGVSTGGSYTVTLGFQQAGVCVAPNIVNHPAAQTVCTGSSVTFTVTATGTDLVYQWRKGGVNIGGATAASYTINAVAAGDAGNYDVVVTNACGTVTSNTAALTVNAGASITQQPMSTTVCLGAPASFSVTATGAGLSYQWRRNGANLSGATNPAYNLAATTAADAGNYDVVITAACGSLTSSTAALTVNATTAINAQPASQTVCAGAAASFSVTATGVSLSYQWRKNGANIGGATASTYAIASTAASDAAQYDVVVTGACGNAVSNAAALTVNAATAITAQPANQTACAGGPATFAVTASGASLTYQWRRNGVNIAGATAGNYVLAAAGAGDVGNYDVVVTGACGTATSQTASLTLNAVTAINTQPANQTVCAGAGANFSVAATDASLSYQWRKNGANFPGATNATFNLAATVADDAGSYDVVVTGACGTLTSESVTLTVNATTAITTQPANQSVIVGQAATFSVTAAGANLSYQWRRNGANLGGATASSYTLNSATPADAGNYDVVVTGACGAATSSTATLAVNCAYAITPASRFFFTGGSGGNNGTISVTTQSGCNWTAVSNAPWLQVTAGANGTGDGTVNYSVAVNPGTSARGGTLTVAGQSFAVQQAAQGSLIEETFAGSFPPAGWTVLDGGTGNGRWTKNTQNPCALPPDVNPAPAPFSSEFALVDAKCPGPNDVLNETLLTPVFDTTGLGVVYLEFFNRFKTGPTANIGDVDVSTNGGQTWTNALRLQGQDYGYPVPETRTVELTPFIGGNPANVQVRLHYYGASSPPRPAAPTGGAEVFWAVDFSIYGFGVTPASNGFTAAGGAGTANVVAAPLRPWTATVNPNGAPWLTITAGASGQGNGTVNYQAAANSGPARNGTLTIAANALAVTQAGAGCPLITVTPANLPGGRQGTSYGQLLSATPAGTYSFAVTSGALPNGLSLVGATLSGTPTVSGTFDFIITATGANNCTGLRMYALTIQPASSGGAVSGTVSYCLDAAKKVPGAMLSANTTPPVSDTTSHLGQYSLPGLSGALTVTPAKSGDVNGISAFDAALVAQQSAGLLNPPLNACQQTAGDGSNNGALSAFDASLIAQVAAGLTPATGVVGAWKFTPANRSYANVTGDLPNENYDAVLVGDVTGNWTPPGARPPNQPLAQTPLALPQLSAAHAANLTVPLIIGNLSGQGIVAYDLAVTFDPAVLQLQNPPVDAANTLSSALTITTNATVPGRLRVAAYGLGALSGAGTLLNLRFVVNGAAGTASPLAWQSAQLNEAAQSLLTPGAVSVTGAPLALEADVAPRGDSNGTVNVADYVQVGRFAIGLDKAAEGGEFQRADCAPRATMGDGQINVADYVQAGRYALGLDAPLNAGGPLAPVTPQTEAFDWRRREPLFSTPRVLRLGGEFIALPGGLLGLAVELEAQGAENGVQFAVRFDAAALRYQGFVFGRDAADAQVLAQTENVAQGELGVLLTLPPGASLAVGARQMAVLVFAPLRNEATQRLPALLPAAELVDAEANPLPLRVVEAKP